MSFEMVPWEEVAIQLDDNERAAYDMAFRAARGRTEMVELRIWGRRYTISPSGKVWLLVEPKPTNPQGESESR